MDYMNSQLNIFTVTFGEVLENHSKALLCILFFVLRNTN